MVSDRSIILRDEDTVLTGMPCSLHSLSPLSFSKEWNRWLPSPFLQSVSVPEQLLPLRGFTAHFLQTARLTSSVYGQPSSSSAQVVHCFASMLLPFLAPSRDCSTYLHGHSLLRASLSVPKDTVIITKWELIWALVQNNKVKWKLGTI